MEQKFSQQIFGDADAKYMSTPELQAIELANKLRGRYDVGVELCCAIGMLSVQLAKVIPKIYAVDLSTERIRCAEKNAEIYGVKNINFVVGNVIDLQLIQGISNQVYTENLLARVVCFLDPDWSNSMNKSVHVNSIKNTSPSLYRMVQVVREYFNCDIIAKIPKTFTIETFDQLREEYPELIIRIEDVLVDGVVRFRFAYIH